MTVELGAAEIALLQDTNLANLGVTRPDGSVHLTPVWVDWDGEQIRINTVIGRAKHRYVERAGTASVLVVDHRNTNRYMSVTGSTTLVTEGAEEHIDALALKYMGEVAYPFRTPEDHRIIVRISVDRLYTWHLDA